MPPIFVSKSTRSTEFFVVPSVLPLPAPLAHFSSLDSLRRAPAVRRPGAAPPFPLPSLAGVGMTYGRLGVEERTLHPSDREMTAEMGFILSCTDHAVILDAITIDQGREKLEVRSIDINARYSIKVVNHSSHERKEITRLLGPDTPSFEHHILIPFGSFFELHAALLPEVKAPTPITVSWWGWSMDRFKFVHALPRGGLPLELAKAK